jgi:uncharacterized protein
MVEVLDRPRAWPFQVMAKPMGPRCNLDCTYCYYLRKDALYPDEHRFRMSPDVLETYIHDYIASQVRTGQREIWFAWQGGEPTMLGLDYFRTIVALERKHARQVSLSTMRCKPTAPCSTTTGADFCMTSSSSSG